MFPIETREIYVISNGEHYKIGVSGNSKKRLKQLQTGCPLKLQLVDVYIVPRRIAKNLEKQLHKMFWQRRLRFNGEWFDLTSEHLSLLNDWISNYSISVK